MANIILFSDQTTLPEYDRPRSERLISGNPQRTTWNHFGNDSGEVFAGVWASEPGAWRIEMGEREDEFFYVTAGRCRLHADDGNIIECGAGDSLVIPAGFCGIFEVVAAMTKHYMIVDRRVQADSTT